MEKHCSCRMVSAKKASAINAILDMANMYGKKGVTTTAESACGALTPAKAMKKNSTAKKILCCINLFLF